MSWRDLLDGAAFLFYVASVLGVGLIASAAFDDRGWQRVESAYAIPSH